MNVCAYHSVEEMMYEDDKKCPASHETAFLSQYESLEMFVLSLASDIHYITDLLSYLMIDAII